MANTLSDNMSDLLSSTTKRDIHKSHARVRADVATISVAAADNDGHIYPVSRLRATDRILTVQPFVGLTVPLGCLAEPALCIREIAKRNERLRRIGREARGFLPVACSFFESPLIAIRMASPQIRNHGRRLQGQRTTEELNSAVRFTC